MRKVHITDYTCPGSVSAVKLGEMIVPEDREDDFKKAACAAVQVLYSDEFRNELGDYISKHASQGEFSAAWEGWDVDKIIAGLKDKINGIQVVTYGGPVAWLKLKTSGNLAYDGQEGGPIRLNEPGLNGRDVASIANSIIHEVSHRVGMTHPHSSSDFSTALSEPPYVIGSILERIINRKH